ncbi:hypothetical protein [Promicromonospora sp. NPDC050249]|uniref:hypothetical protein n=1 Tax=Promicromonospora sp. NPDC050249 TaxID=3154743 RepID=UPI0033DC2C5C
MAASIAATELFGYFIEVTEVQRAAASREATASIEASAERWSGIERAQGTEVRAREAVDKFLADPIRPDLPSKGL